MSKRLTSAAFGSLLLVGICLAQSTNSLQSQGSGVTLSITVTNNSYAIGSDMTVFAAVQNVSTNDVHLASFIISLTGDGGKTYNLTEPELGNGANMGGNIKNILKAGRIRSWQTRLELNHYFGAFGIELVDKDVEPGSYMLKAVQYYDGDKLSVQSNLLKVEIKK